MQKLNLGSGNFLKKGYINIDFYNPKADVQHNLNIIPYPFDSNSIDIIEADHVIEHLHDVFAVMVELHRIIKPNGILKIKVPHFSRGMSHPDHKRGFDITFPYYFDPTFKGGYTGVYFKIEKLQFKWLAQPYLKKQILPLPKYIFATIFGIIFDMLANLSPMFCSRIWCYLVGGFEEINFLFIKK
jgi:SAM-dependent methyltransferase